MALTKKQIDTVIKLFTLSFSNDSNEKNRKNLFIEFEDIFGNGIPNWKSVCKERIEQYAPSKTVIEHFDMLANRKKNVQSDYLIRELTGSDLESVRELINSTFSMRLTSYDDERFKMFIESGYSFVAYNDEGIVGIALCYLLPDLSMDAVYIDTFAVAEAVRGQGIGTKLLSHISNCALSHKIHSLRLQTDRSNEAYEIYKHWGFEEIEMVQMKKYIL